MIVFKNYFKIVKKHLGLIIMYASISIIISIMNTSYISKETEYVPSNPDLAILNYDDSLLVNNFIKYMNKNSNIIEIEDNSEKMQDALYTAKVSSILVIPKDFTKDLFTGGNTKIEIKKGIKNYSSYIELLTNKYFKIANIYIHSGMSEQEIVNNIEIDLQKESNIKILSKEESSNLEKLALFYNFENYAFLSIVIFVIGTIMCIYNDDNIRKRNLVSKMKDKTFNKWLLLGHISLTLLLWLTFVIISGIIYGKVLFTTNGLLIMINSLIFIITVTSMAYLIGGFIKNKNIISGVINVIGLGLSFISGCFVPIELLDNNVVNFSKLFPSYWYIQNNNLVAELSSFDHTNLNIIIKNMTVVLIMGIIYLILSIVFNKKRKKIS